MSDGYDNDQIIVKSNHKKQCVCGSFFPCKENVEKIPHFCSLALILYMC